MNENIIKVTLKTSLKPLYKLFLWKIIILIRKKTITT